MTLSWASLAPDDHNTFSSIVAFLTDRLAEQDTIDWALELKPQQRIERIAISYLLNSPRAISLAEPWATAWRLIEESWFVDIANEDDDSAIYRIQQRLRTGDRSGSVISALVCIVAPRLKVESIKSNSWQPNKKKERPRTYKHLLWASLTSSNLIDLDVLELSDITDVEFLKSLASSLESAINHGLNIGRRLQLESWKLGDIARIEHTNTAAINDPDSHNRGIAPAVRLLYAVVERIADFEPTVTQLFIQRWRLETSPVYVRLWAAISRNRQLTSAKEVYWFLVNLDDQQFWEVREFPEIAELRAKRFCDLDPAAQNVIAERLKKSPPRSHWSRKANAQRVKQYRLSLAIQELRKVDPDSSILPSDIRDWMNIQIESFPELVVKKASEASPEDSIGELVSPALDNKYDVLEGNARLHELENALSKTRDGWDEFPAESAIAWLRQPGKVALLLSDLEATNNGGDEFPLIWNRYGRMEQKQPGNTDSTESESQKIGERVLALLNQLSDKTLTTAIYGVSHWLASWNKLVVTSTMGLSVWLRAWPIAVAATNATFKKEVDADLSVTIQRDSGDQESMNLDTLNPPTGKLVGVFLAALPSLDHVENPFADGTIAQQMRDAVFTAKGQSLLIVLHRLIEELPYFLRADRNWTEEHLIKPLQYADGASLILWRAVALHARFKNVLEIIGHGMAEKATDRRLEIKVRKSLTFSIIIESLHAFLEPRSPAIPNAHITQMLRKIDDEVRVSAAEAIAKFVRQLSVAQREQSVPPPSAAELFRCAAQPFLRAVWPQERSLSTSGVSKALAKLPAISDEAFSEAVCAIERFLVPFKVWTIYDYGLGNRGSATKKLDTINSEEKASGLLRLLDLTIDNAEGAVIPRDLTDALDQIRMIAPDLEIDPAFRRLSTAARN
jgi:hypothetical protein